MLFFLCCEGVRPMRMRTLRKKTKQLSAADVCVLKIFVANYDWCVVIFCKSFLHIVSDWGKKFGAHSEG